MKMDGCNRAETDQRLTKANPNALFSEQPGTTPDAAMFPNESSCTSGSTPDRMKMDGCNRAETDQRLTKANPNANTVQRRITIASVKVFFKGRQCRCSGRFFFHFDIFRLITRGLI